MISHGRTWSFCLKVFFQLSSSAYLGVCKSSYLCIACGKSMNHAKVFCDDFVCMLSMQSTCCTEIMFFFALYLSYRALDERMWIRDRFQKFDPGIEMYDFFYANSRFSDFQVFFWFFMIMLSLMYFCFAWISFHMQFIMIHASSHLLSHRTCSVLTRCFVQACQWQSHTTYVVDIFLRFRCVLLGSIVSTCPSGGNLVDGSPPAASIKNQKKSDDFAWKNLIVLLESIFPTQFKCIPWCMQTLIFVHSPWKSVNHAKVFVAILSACCLCNAHAALKSWFSSFIFVVQSSRWAHVNQGSIS